MAGNAETAAFVEDLNRHVGPFVEDVNLQLGNQDSKHQVFFGTMPDVTADPVAVKPFTVYGRADGEKNNLRKIDRLGLEAIEPLKVATGGLMSYLITRYQPGLNHLGMVDWHAASGNARLHSLIEPTIAQGATTAAENHDAGVAHGDFQVKNATYTNDGRPIFLDAERATFHPGKDQFTRAANGDLQKLGRSMLSRGLLLDRPASDRVSYLNDTLLTTYLDAISRDRYDQTADERRAVITNFWVQAINHQAEVKAQKANLPQVQLLPQA